MSTAYTTIQGGTLPQDWPEDFGSSGTMATFATQNFTSDDSCSWIAGDGESLRSEFVTETGITVIGNMGTYASYSLPKTDTCTPNTVRYFTRIFDSRGTYRYDLYDKSRHLRTSLGDSISELQWALDNQQFISPQPDGAASITQVNNIVNAAVLNAALNQDYAIGSFSTLAVALAAMPATGATLVVNQATSVPSNTTVPSYVTTRVTGKGYFNLTTGSMLAIQGPLEAGSRKIFANALSGQGTISFAGNVAGVVLDPNWWAINTPGTTDMTAAVQAALTASGGRRKVFFPQGSYLITDTLTIPAFSGDPAQYFSPMVIEGAGPFLSNLINKASANKPTLLINRDLVNVRGLGFWSAGTAYPNDGIKISLAGRIHIQDNEFFVNGNGILLQKAQSVWIQNNYGSVSSGSSLPPAGTGTFTFPATASFVYADIPDANGYANHIFIQDNMDEGYSYHVYTNNPTGRVLVEWGITGNQFESPAVGGIKLDYVQEFEIASNYLSEGGAGYSINLTQCRDGRVGPNYFPLPPGGSFDDKISTLRLDTSTSLMVMGVVPRLYLLGLSRGIVAHGGRIDRIQDETSDHLLGLVNTNISSITVPLGTMSAEVGRATWFSDTTNFAAYPTVRLGDRIFKVTPASGASPGWMCTTASSAGALVQVTGVGPSPVVLGDYADPVAYDFRITVLTGGVTGTATYKIEWKTAGGGSYADLTNTTTTTELAHLIERISGGPIVSFAIRWPTGQTYVSGNQWTLTAVVAPVWKVMAVLA